jgi:dephospho-CoA kinase
MTQKPFVLGLTGSIGMGKSTTSKMFADAGIPVWDADAIVHHLYSGDTPAVRKIALLVPGAVENQTVNRNTLKTAIARDKTLLQKIELIVHPLVTASRQAFIAAAATNGDKIVIIDHPLLFESRSADYCDAVLVVSTTPSEQRRRVIARGTMDAETLNIILAKQLPDAEKRQRADFIVETTTLDAARTQVQAVIQQIRDQLHA